MGMSFTSILYFLSLLTLPWVGLGVIHLLTGRDVGAGLQVSWVFLALAIVVFLCQGLPAFSRKPVSGKLPKVPPFLLFVTAGTFAAVFLSGLGITTVPSLEPVASSWSRWARQIFQLAIMMSFLWWAALWTRGPTRWQRTLDFLFIGVFVQIAYGLFQGIDFFHNLYWFGFLEGFFTSNPSILSGSERLYLNNMMQDIPRLRGTVCEPLYLGNFLLMAWPFLLSWRRPLFMRWALGILMGIMLVLTWSRGAWIGMGLQLLVLGIFTSKPSFQWKKIGRVSRGRGFFFPGFAFAVILLLLVVVNSVADGFLLHRLQATFNNQDWSNLTRFYSMKAAWLAFLESPVIGIGWGQFAFHFPLLVEPMGLQSQFTWPVVNNFPLQILCETGLFGFVVFVGAGLIILRKAWLILGRDESGMVLSGVVAVAGIWFQLLTFSQYNLAHIWVGTGLLLAALLDSGRDPENTGSGGTRP
jgi:O-antigen ligase